MAFHLVTFCGAFSVNTINVALVDQSLRNVRMGREESAYLLVFVMKMFPQELISVTPKCRTRKRDTWEAKSSISCLGLSKLLRSLILKSRLQEMVGLSSCWWKQALRDFLFHWAFLLLLLLSSCRVLHFTLKQLLGIKRFLTTGYEQDQLLQ